MRNAETYGQGPLLPGMAIVQMQQAGLQALACVDVHEHARSQG